MCSGFSCYTRTASDIKRHLGIIRTHTSGRNTSNTSLIPICSFVQKQFAHPSSGMTMSKNKDPREECLKAKYLLTSYVSTKAMKPSGKAIAKDTMAANSPSLDSSVEISRRADSSLRCAIDSSRISPGRPAGGAYKELAIEPITNHHRHP